MTPLTARPRAARGLVAAVAAGASLLLSVPATAHTPVGADVTEAIGFAGSPPAATRACVGSLVVVPAANVTTFPPAATAVQYAYARSTCAGNLPAGTWYGGAASFIDGIWRNGVQLSNTRCYADDCLVPLPSAGSRVTVIGDFHWSLASGTWSVQEPGGCVPDGAAFAIRCATLTQAYV